MARKYEFAEFCLNQEDFSLSRLGTPLDIKPKVFDLLQLLIENRDRVLTREELFDRLWQGREVCDTTLSNHIKSARQLLGDDGRKQAFIRTIHGRGYQFVAELKDHPEPLSDEELESDQTESNSKKYRYAYLMAAALFSAIASLFFFLHLLLPPHEENAIPLDIGEIKSIAVLPVAIENPNLPVSQQLSSLPQQIISDLIYIDKLHVRSWSRVNSPNIKRLSFEEKIKTLSVDYLLISSFQENAGRYELSLELLNTQKQKLLWKRSTVAFSWPQLLSQHGSIAREMVAALKIELGEEDQQQLSYMSGIDPKSYQHYFEAISLPWDEHSSRKALSLLQESLRLNPDFSLAYVALATRMRRFEQFVLDDAGIEGNAESFLLRVIELDQQSVDALFQLSLIYAESNRLEQALQMARSLNQINPSDASSHFALGYVCRYAGAIDCARQELEAAVKIDPHNPLYRSVVGLYSGLGQYENIPPLLENYRPSAFADTWTGIAMYRLGKTTKSRISLKKVITQHGGLWGQVAKIHLALIEKDPQAGLEAIAELENSKVYDGETSYYIAAYYGFFNAREQAFAKLNQAIELGYFNVDFIRNNIALRQWQDDPEFLAIVSKAEQRQEEFLKFYKQTEGLP